MLGVAAVMDRRELEVGDQMREHILDIGLMLFQRDLVSAALEVVEIVQFSWFCVFKEQFGWAWTLSLRRRLNGRGASGGGGVEPWRTCWLIFLRWLAVCPCPFNLHRCTDSVEAVAVREGTDSILRQSPVVLIKQVAETCVQRDDV